MTMEGIGIVLGNPEVDYVSMLGLHRQVSNPVRGQIWTVQTRIEYMSMEGFPSIYFYSYYRSILVDEVLYVLNFSKFLY